MHMKQMLAMMTAACCLGGTLMLPGTLPASAEGEADWYLHAGFEDSADGWTGRAATVSQSQKAAYAGSASLLITGRTASWCGASCAIGTDTFVPGQRYSFSANAMSAGNAETTDFKFTLQYTGADGTVAYSEIASATGVQGAWVQLANTEYTVPADASEMQIYVETSDGSKEDFYIDEIIAAPEGTELPGAGIPVVRRLLRGDVSFDGAVNVIDLTLVKAGLTRGFADALTEKAADTDGDGTVSLTDLVLLHKYVAGLLDAFPEPPVPDNPWDTYEETASPEMQKFYETAILSMGNTARLCEKIAKAQSGEQVRVSYLGGSITEGGRTDTCYAARSYRYFADTFGTGSNVAFTNAGMSGTSSVVGLLRAENDILKEQPDVIFIEFSVNDHPGESYEKGFEGLVRKCLMQDNEPAVILLINRSKGGYSSQGQMEKIGRNYDLPIISMDNALTYAFNTGLLTLDDYYTDEYHPHAEGAALISDCIGYYYRQALKTENKSAPYTMPSTVAYGSEYTTATIVPLSELQDFSAGSFSSANGYATLPYGLTNSKNGNTPITFKTQGRGMFIVYQAKSDGMGTLNIDVNGKASKLSGNKQYTWGGPDTDLVYIQDTVGELNVSIGMENQYADFTIWGIGIIK
ncbi:MAG: carbohydrate binding domain-containing protein [Oscillospiraceae bacterium]|nr:carbohydrate binding domain-containing protein [Oscillospiraceae bacterium]